MFQIKTKKNPIPFRLNLLFVFVFLLFTLLILRLGLIQIVHGEDYKKEIARTENVHVSTQVPRGKMYDRNGEIIVNNKLVNAITYTRTQETSQSTILDLAEKLSTLIEKETDKLTERDLKDFWILTHRDEVKELSSQIKSDNPEIKDDEIYKQIIETLSSEQIDSFSQEELEVAAIFRELNSGYALSPVTVKDKTLTNEELAVVAENLDSLPGITITSNWDRKYEIEGTLRSVLGNITTSEEGLPLESLDYFLSRGYNRKDRVGKSQLEQQYEDVLVGQKGQIQFITNKAGAILQSEVIREGVPGNDLVLSIDFELQQEVEKILIEELINAKEKPGATFLDRAFVVLMHPQTGEVLSLAGKQISKKDGSYEIQDYALGTITYATEVGSAVKGATVLSGFDSGVIRPGEVIRDQRMSLKGTPDKGSYKNLGPVNDLQALQKSSNVYMFHIALRSLGSNYYSGMAVPRNTEAIVQFRNYFNQFGLGVPTGIDLPYEEDGYASNDIFQYPGLFLDFAIGQYDTYTPMQLAQYISTIANGGYRMKPQLVHEIRQPTISDSLGPILKPFTPVVLNKIDMSQEHLLRVQQGFKQVMEPGGTAGSWFSDKAYKPAGKTGTAQRPYYDVNTKTSHQLNNLTLVGYAPYDQPEIAFSIVVPFLDNDQNPVNKIIGERVLDKYFELKVNREGITSDTTEGEEDEKLETDDSSGEEQAND
ncbi:peptidoglycan D,D-transpeptidase FtsI family protein [Bacillus salitolerans]|uniref:serine-type D-Ala-D-Ala carboxypeptidase n=1 Tax=Bacillus salitolerans TaxID=1437434 RepID=A0ABW4LQC2_9BACI